MSEQPAEYLQGVVDRLTFHSAESGYTIARFKVPRTPEPITVTGSFANIQPGQTLHLTGQWRNHPKYGEQFQVFQYRETKPATLTGLEKYLGSGLIKGVGPVTAKRIVAHFGLETLDIIEHEIDRLQEVPGIAKKRVKMIQTAWESQKVIKEVMLFLQGNGVSTTYAVKIFKQYGQDAIAVVSNNPYQLAQDVYGIGFITADTIARNLGIEPGSPFRYRSGLVHVLNQAAEDGHCFLPQAELVASGVKCLTLEEHQPNPQQLEQLIVQMGHDKGAGARATGESALPAMPPRSIRQSGIWQRGWRRYWPRRSRWTAAESSSGYSASSTRLECRFLSSSSRQSRWRPVSGSASSPAGQEPARPSPPAPSWPYGKRWVSRLP